MLNIVGSEYDFCRVLYVVLQECEHRRRSFDQDELQEGLTTVAREKLAQIRRAYDEIGGSASYWGMLECEVIETALPQYIDQAASMNALEQTGFKVFRGGDLAARFIFALGGLLIGSVIIALPFIPIFENLFAFALTVGGFIYPDLVRYTWERRYARFLNRLVTEADLYQRSVRANYLTTKDIDEQFEAPGQTEQRAEPQRQLPPRNTLTS